MSAKSARMRCSLHAPLPCAPTGDAQGIHGLSVAAFNEEGDLLADTHHFFPSLVQEVDVLILGEVGGRLHLVLRALWHVPVDPEVSHEGQPFGGYGSLPGLTVR